MTASPDQLAPDDFWTGDTTPEYTAPKVPRLHIVETLRDAPVFSDRPACAGRPDLTDATRGKAVDEARALCATCPVFMECSEWVSGEPDFVGVAGGELFTPTTRRKGLKA
jgi:hypothetical protein